MDVKKAKVRRPRNDAERRRAFFYAEADADVYDVAADLNTPLFSLMHATLLDLVRRHRELRPDGQQRADWVFLDIGSGTGAESLSILREFPRSRVVAFDLCEPMHAIFRRKVAKELGKRATAERCRFLTGDIAGSAGSKRALMLPLRDWKIPGSYDLVISALALHHLTAKEKRSVYQRLAGVLKPGGLFVNADLFTYQSPRMARLADDFGLNWIRKQFTDPDPHLKRAQQRLGRRAKPLMNSWLSHCINYNLPDPIESSDDALASARRNATGQARMLIDAGFSEVACPFRYWQVGVLWAIR